MKKEDIKTPPIGLTFSRSDMPQLGHTGDFLSHLQRHKVKFNHEIVDPHTLRSSQGEFDNNVIHAIATKQSKKRPTSSIIVSRDNYVVDGHHRWAANYNTKTKTKIIRVHLPILEILRLAKTFPTTKYKAISDVKNSIVTVARESRAKKT